MEEKAVAFDRKAAMQYLQGFLDLDRAEDVIQEINAREPNMAARREGLQKRKMSMKKRTIVVGVILGVWTLLFLISYFTLGEGIGGMILGIGGIVTFFILLMVFLGKTVSANKAFAAFEPQFNAFMSEPQRAQRAAELAQAQANAQNIGQALAWTENTYRNDADFIPMRSWDGNAYNYKYSAEAFRRMLEYLGDGRAMTLPQAVQRLDTEIMHRQQLAVQVATQAVVRQSAAAVIAAQQQTAEQIRRTGEEISSSTSSLESTINSIHRGY